MCMERSDEVNKKIIEWGCVNPFSDPYSHHDFTYMLCYIMTG
jgi:hypothetical protein